MVLATVAFLMAMVRHQAAPELSVDPRLQQKVDAHLKRVLLPDLLRYLKVHSNQRFIIDPAMSPLMVCVFADKQPLWLIMKDVADVLGGQWRDLGSEWRFVESPESKRFLPNYERDEDQVLRSDVVARARALSDAVSRHRWSEVATSSDSPLLVPPEDPTPEQWAQAKIHDPAYFVAGLMFARTGIPGGKSHKFDCPGGFSSEIPPTSYKLIAPPNERVAETLQCSEAGESGAGLEGTQICVRATAWCGSFQSSVVGSGFRPENRPKLLIRYPRPVGDLAETKEGKWLLSWDTSLGEADDPILDREVVGLSLRPSPFVGGEQGIEDHLEALAESLKVPVVSDAFRMPVIGKEAASGSDLRKWLESLRTRQSCFVRVQNGSVCVRHGGFWDLRKLEIPEEALRRFEAIDRPGLSDYADFAFEQGLWGHGEFSYLMPMFESQQIPLTLFDSKPFQTSPVALAAFGELTDQQRQHVLSGGFIDWYRNVEDDVQVNHHISYQSMPKNARKVLVDTPETTGGTRGTDYFISYSAAWGAFYGAIPIGLESRLLESVVAPTAYRSLWGDNPDDVAQFVSRFEWVGPFLAHFFSLRDVRPTDGGPSSRQYGTFSFFSAISDVDGVVTTVVIPDKSAPTPLPQPGLGGNSGGG